MSLALRMFALAVSCAVLAVGCGGGTPGTVVSGEPISLAELTDAAQASAAATSGRFEFSLEMSLPGADKRFSFTGEGAFDASTQRAAFTIDMSSFARLLGGLFTGMGGADASSFDDPDGWKIDAVQDGRVSYVRLPAITGRLPAGKSWVRTSAGHTSASGVDFGQFQKFTGSDPRTMLDSLEAVSGEIETVGSETMRGVETTHYRATIDPADYAKLARAGKRDELGSLTDQLVAQSGIGSMPVDVWVDGSGLVRKLAIAFSATQPGTPDATDASMTFELYDLGDDVRIELPRASQVVDATALRP